jgi:site-specific DNA recombinase
MNSITQPLTQSSLVATGIRYCLYARKSSESDERQAMSIDSQIKEMRELATREGLHVTEVRQESCSAKESGYRPVFRQLLLDIRDGKFDGILAWAPDRLSRNAGDLGSVVDLMDQNRLQQIRTYSQTFSNTPNEKFLLMILCSQAKLENDNKGVNVRRGIRAKCEMGWRPGVAPLGYYNRSFNGVKDIVIDPDRGDTINEMFSLVAYKQYSGRAMKRYLDEKKFTNRSGKSVTLSQIYEILRNPFYHGMFEYPKGTLYNGSHTPLVSKDLFDKVQKQLVAPHKSKWGAKQFAFKYLMHCTCGSQVTGEEKFKKLKDGSYNRHVYYHCTRSTDYSCREPYISETGLIEELMNFVDTFDFTAIKISEKLNNSLEDYQRMTREILRQQAITASSVDIRSYGHYVLREGTMRERADFIRGLKLPLILKSRRLILKATSYGV